MLDRSIEAPLIHRLLEALRFPRPAPDRASVEDWLERRVVGAKTPGLTAAVFHRDGVIWTRAFGTADVLTRGPIEPRTSFRWFSTTKLVTAMVILQLVERGALGLDEPVVDHLPWFRVRPADAVVTTAHLLSHSSGLRHPIPVRWAHPEGVGCRRGTQFAREVFEKHRRLRRRPGRVGHYTNLGYLVLEALVEAVAREPFDTFVRANVLDPLAMRDTRFAHEPSDAPLARGHARLLDPHTLALALVIPRSLEMVRGRAAGFAALTHFGLDGCGYGGLIGPLGDLVRLGRAHLLEGQLDGVRVLEASTARAMREVRSWQHGGAFGLAWWLGLHAGADYLHHGGAAGGFRSDLRLYPARNLGVAVLANASVSYTLEVTEALGACDWP